MALTDLGYLWWPGMFTHDRLHRVAPANLNRVPVGQSRLAIADCGAVCLPPDTLAYRQLPVCDRCAGRLDQRAAEWRSVP